MNAIRRGGAWPVLLLLPHPPFSAVYVLAVRAGWLEPSFAAPLIAGIAPLGAAVLSALRLARGADRRRDAVLLALALIEIVWAVTFLAIVGFAVGLRGG